MGFLSSINDSVESLPQDEEFEQAKQQFFFRKFHLRSFLECANREVTMYYLQNISRRFWILSSHKMNLSLLCWDKFEDFVLQL